MWIYVLRQATKFGYMHMFPCKFTCFCKCSFLSYWHLGNLGMLPLLWIQHQSTRKCSNLLQNVYKMFLKCWTSLSTAPSDPRPQSCRLVIHIQLLLWKILDLPLVHCTTWLCLFVLYGIPIIFCMFITETKILLPYFPFFTNDWHKTRKCVFRELEIIETWDNLFHDSIFPSPKPHKVFSYHDGHVIEIQGVNY